MKRLLKRLFSKKLNNKGVSLVEVICALGIFAVVGGSVAGIMYVSTNTYSRSSMEIDVQQEAQFATNLISNLVLDASSVENDGGLLKIKQGADEYVISHDTSNDTLWISKNGGDSQLLAEHIHTFDFNTDRFNETKALSLNFNVNKGDREFEEHYDVTARNGDVSGNSTTVTIDAPRIVVLEPNESYDLDGNTSVNGAYKNISWEISGSGMSSTIGSNKYINVPNTETANSFTVIGTQKDSSGNAQATTSVVVYVRRVNDISISPRLISGTDLLTDAQYEIDASVFGNNLDPKALELNYFDPYSVEWSVNGEKAVVVGTPVSGSKDEEPKIIIKLTDRLISTDTITVTAKSSHSFGNNRSGIEYDNSIIKTWTLAGPAYTVYSSNLSRGSDSQLAIFDGYDAVKSKAILDYPSWSQNFRSRYFYRIREIEMHANGTYSTPYEWVDWREWPQSGDNEDSKAINMRPVATEIFEPSKYYELEVCLTLRNADNNTYVWPAEYPSHEGENPQSVVTNLMTRTALQRGTYIIHDMMKPVEAAYCLRYKGGSEIFMNQLTAGTVDSPFVLDKNRMYELKISDEPYVKGTKHDMVKNSMMFYVDQYIGGTWQPVTTYQDDNTGKIVTASNGLVFGVIENKNGKIEMVCGGDQNHKMIINSASTKFRVRVGASSFPIATYAGGKNYTVPQNPGPAMFSNVETGQGVYIFEFR